MQSDRDDSSCRNPPQPAEDEELQSILGPARLAYFTPTGELSPLSERKAVFLLTASGLIGTVLIFFLPRIAELLEHPSRTVATLVSLLAPSLILLILCAACFAYRAVTTGIPDPPRSLAFFKHIAEHPLEDYEHLLKQTTHREALRAILHYNYSIAQQAVLKFRRVESSLRCMRVAICLWMGLLLIIAVAG